MGIEEKELDSLETEQEQEQGAETEDNEDEEGQESTEDNESEESEESEGEEGESADQKPKDKTQKRIDQLTAAKKTLEEQLTESKEALDDARERSKFLEDELEKTKQSYGTGVSSLWTKNGKHMYELTNKEFGEVVELLLSNAEAAQTDAERRDYMKQLKECNILRNSGQGIAEQEAQIEKTEEQLWVYEWGVVTTAILKNSEISEADEKKLNSLIAPIFWNRKKDNEAKFAYRKLTEGGVEAKFRHVSRLMQDMGLYEKASKEDYKKNPNPGKTVGKGSPSTKSTETKTFTRAQIAKMSLPEFERNEKAINKALAKGQIQ